jgi:2-polyprenyl-3-methyl-5-hydroxy-6-metoxy-1,4-benzoquinol methylase
MSCNCCDVTDGAFGEKDAENAIRDYRRRGPSAQTRVMLGAIREVGLKGVTLLDIGGGAGVIHHELLRDVAISATHVDASSAYLRAARQEALRVGHADRLEFIHADFSEVAASLPAADIVTLDRVVCCYPDYRSLLTPAASHARRILALSYPRAVWYVRFSMILINLLQRLRRDPFRVFLHPPLAMDDLLRARGLRRRYLKRLWVWEIALYSSEA